MYGLADVDGFKICIQVFVWLGFLPLTTSPLHATSSNLSRPTTCANRGIVKFITLAHRYQFSFLSSLFKLLFCRFNFTCIPPPFFFYLVKNEKEKDRRWT